MKTFNLVKVPLFSLLLATAGCNDAALHVDDGLGPVAYRPGGSIFGNSPILGGVAGGVMAKDYYQTKTNLGGDITYLFGQIPHLGVTRDVTSWTVDNDGRLHLFYLDNFTGIYVDLSGEDVVEMVWLVMIDDGDSINTGEVKIVNATCPGTGVCQYEMYTDIENPDEENYPISLSYGSHKWPLCSIDDNHGTLGPDTHNLVFAKNTYHEFNGDLTDVSIASDNSVNSLFCVNAAMSKGMYYLRVFNDNIYDPNPNALASDAQVNALVKAYRAFHGGATYTVPGQTIWLDDLVGWHFSSKAREDKAILEGVYNETGMGCRGPIPGHRYVNPELEIPGYDAIPICPTDLTLALPYGSIAVWAVPAS